MLNENPNDFNWKKKLEDVNSLPAETLTDKNAAWEKLYNRLHRKPDRISVIWYLAAAACILTAIITPLLTPNNKKDVTVNVHPVQTPSNKATTRNVTPLKEITIAVSPSTLIEKRINTRPALVNNKEKSSPNEILENSGVVPAGLNNLQNDQRVPSISISPVLHVPLSASPAVVITKKKLKVVHINELGEWVEETNNMAHNEYNRSIQFRFINQEVFTNFSLPSNNTGIKFFKTSNPPSN